MRFVLAAVAVLILGVACSDDSELLAEAQELKEASSADRVVLDQLLDDVQELRAEVRDLEENARLGETLSELQTFPADSTEVQARAMWDECMLSRVNSMGTIGSLFGDAMLL